MSFRKHTELKETAESKERVCGLPQSMQETVVYT